jgi:sugar lactone lactonase YvrE
MSTEISSGGTRLKLVGKCPADMTVGKTEAVRAHAFKAVSDEPARLGESPVCCPSDDAVWWVDVVGHKLIRTYLDGETTTWPTPETPGFVQINREARPIVGMERGLYSFDAETGSFTRILSSPQAGTRFNDSCVDMSGTLWAGTMPIANSGPVGVLYRIRDEGPPEPVLGGFVTINGLAVDEKRRRLYVSDSHPSVQTVWVLDLPDDGLMPENRRIFARFEGLPGRPDGSAIDSEGGYWIAGIDGGELYRFGAEGRLTQRVAVPFNAPTKLAFVGRDGATVAVTSRADDTNAGHLVACAAEALGVTGIPPNLCAIGAQAAA